MNWINLTDISQLDALANDIQPGLIFKHSTRCSISMMAKRRFEMDASLLPSSLKLYFLDLLKHRDLSAAIAEKFQVQHESPQILLIADGQCILEASHSDIAAAEVAEVVQAHS